MLQVSAKFTLLLVLKALGLITVFEKISSIRKAARNESNL
jgi:hypothetical protein